MGNVFYIIGQVPGIVAIGLGIASYQMRSRQGIVLVQLFTTVTFVLHYFLIGAWSGMALNMVSTVRNVIYYHISKKGGGTKVWSIVFAIIMSAVGILSWQDWYCVFIVAALAINCLGLACENPQSMRKSILITSPLAWVYNCFVWSVGGVIFEGMSVVSAALGIWRNTSGHNG